MDGGNGFDLKAWSEPGKWYSLLGWITFALMAAALYLVFMWVPNEKTMGVVQKIFYFHVPVAWIGFLAFGVVFAASIAYLKTRNRNWDILAFSSAEIGVLFTTLVLITGPIWAKAAWGAWWTWDPRLTTTLVLWFIYVAYLIIRASAEGDEKKARFAAIFGIVGFLDVPIVWFAIRWWRTIHPVVFESDSTGLDSSMLVTFQVSLFAFTLLYAYLLRQRVAVEACVERLSDIKEQLRSE